MYIGVDTHKKEHVLVTIDEQGRRGGTHHSPNTPEGWAHSVAWARAQGSACRWGIENSGSLGKGFAQFLLAQGETAVHEVSPHRTAQYRRRGRTQDKTDETDALAIARLLLAEGEQLPRVRRDDTSTELRLLSDHRDNMLVERTRLINQLHGQMLQIDPSYKEKSGRLTAEAGVIYCRDLTITAAGDLIQTRLLIIRQLAAQILLLNADIAAVTADLERRVRESQTPLLALRGVGTVVAARVIGGVGDDATHLLGAGVGGLGGDRARRGVVGWPGWLPAQSGRQSPTQSGHPHHRPSPAAVRSACASLLCQETRRRQERAGRDALPETPPRRRALSAPATGAGRDGADRCAGRVRHPCPTGRRPTHPGARLRRVHVPPVLRRRGHRRPLSPPGVSRPELTGAREAGGAGARSPGGRSRAEAEAPRLDGQGGALC